jgi:hypothetical protein
VHLGAALDQVQGGLGDADVRLDAADQSLIALAEVEPLDAGGGELDLLESLRARWQAVGHLGHGRTEPLRVLLRDDDRDADRGCAADEHRGARGNLIEAVERLAKGLLDVDDDQGRTVGAQSHAATPSAKERCR